MATDVFDRETLLDLSVNVIPLFIILFFVVVFAVISPFGYHLVPTAVQMGLLVVPFVGLAVLTYFSGRAIAESEAAMEAREVELAANAPDSSDETSEATGEGAAENAERAIPESQTTDDE